MNFWELFHRVQAALSWGMLMAGKFTCKIDDRLFLAVGSQIKDCLSRAGGLRLQILGRSSTQSEGK